MASNDASSGAPETNAPTELGGYRLIELLGRGGMGEVWRAEREGPGGIRRRAAVKRILPALVNNPTLRERFLAEARINTRLESPNIVQVLDYGDQPEPYLVLEYVEGVTASELLRDLAQTRQRIPVVAAAFIAAEVASGLDHAHRKRDEEGRPLNIVHRDVSPQNILISLDGAVKIGDFGVARSADNQFRTQHGMQIGKIGYMPPEQMQGQPIDARADVFSLGVTLWELLTVQPMLPRDDTRAALEMLFTKGIQTPSQVDPRVPVGMDAALMPALAIDPTQRYASAGAFAQALRSFVHSLAPGFDSNELMRILAKLMPQVRFHVPTNTLTPGGVLPPTASPGPGANAAVAAVAPRAPQMMPAMSVPMGGGPSALASASPAAPSQPRAGQGRRVSSPSNPPRGPARGFPQSGGETLPPLVQSSPWPLLVVAGLLVVVVAGLAITVGLKRSQHATPNAADTNVAPVMPTRVPLTATGVPAQPPTPVVPAMVGGPSDPTGAPPPTPMDPGVPAVQQPAPQQPMQQQPVQQQPVQQQPVQPIVAPTPPGNASNPSHAQPRPRDDGNRALARQIQGQLAPLRGMVRACLGVREGSGSRVTLGVHYDPVTTAVQSVEIQTSAAVVGPAERGCVEETVRGAIHLEPSMGQPTRVWQVYEF